MPATGRISGARGQVKMDPTGGSTLVVVANLNHWTLDMATDKIEVTAFQDVNKVFVQGLPSYKGTLGGFYDSGDMSIFNVALGTVAANLSLYPSSLDTATFFGGKAWLDSAINVDAKGAVTISSNFEAAGPWTLTHT